MKNRRAGRVVLGDNERSLATLTLGIQSRRSLKIWNSVYTASIFEWRWQRTIRFRCHLLKGRHRSQASPSAHGCSADRVKLVIFFLHRHSPSSTSEIGRGRRCCTALNNLRRMPRKRYIYIRQKIYKPQNRAIGRLLKADDSAERYCIDIMHAIKELHPMIALMRFVLTNEISRFRFPRSSHVNRPAATTGEVISRVR